MLALPLTHSQYSFSHPCISNYMESIVIIDFRKYNHIKKEVRLPSGAAVTMTSQSMGFVIARMGLEAQLHPVPPA